MSFMSFIIRGRAPFIDPLRPLKPLNLLTPPFYRPPL